MPLNVNKVAVLAILLVAAIYLVFMPLIFPRSIEAITNAPVTVVRASIDGSFTRASATVGSVVRTGEPVGRIVNDRADEKFLLELQNSRALLDSTVRALDDQIARLTVRRDNLAGIVEKSRDNLIARLESKLREQTFRVGGLAVGLALQEADAERKARLAKKKVVAAVNSDNADKTAEVARLTLDAEREQLKQLELQVLAARTDLFFDEDGSLANARLRIDEIEELLTRLTSEEMSKRLELAEVEASIGRERRRLEALAAADLTAPVSGRIWQVAAMNSEFVQEGDPVLEVVNCATSLVTATVSERTFNRLEIGQAVEFVAEADGRSQRGQIVQSYGPESRVDAARFAVRPAVTETKEFRIVAELDPAADPQAGTCTVGRTGKLFFKPRYEESLSRSIHAFWDWMGAAGPTQAVAKPIDRNTP